MSRQLALFGGPPVAETPFPPYNAIGPEEKAAAMRVLDSGVLSGFVGRAREEFQGGEEVRRMESAWSSYFGTRHAVSMNSATSCLYAAIAALDPEVGDEIIVSPYTMIASATCALASNAIPVFADVDPHTFNLDPASIEANVTERTRAIVVVHLFGLPADMDPIMEIAEKHGLDVIEDCAQAPGAYYRGRMAGAIGRIGIFSLNAHKTIQCGEGGVCVTDDDDLAFRLRLIRNHGEACVEGFGYERISNIVGQNYRLGEIEAAIAAEQLKKLEFLNRERAARAAFLDSVLADMPGVDGPRTPVGRTHVYYLYPMTFDSKLVGVHRDVFAAAMNAEGVAVVPGYVQPMYWEPLYQRKIAHGSKGFPWTSPDARPGVSYARGICPHCESLFQDSLMYTPLIHPPLDRNAMDLVKAAFEKVYSQREQLKNHGRD